MGAAALIEKLTSGCMYQPLCANPTIQGTAARLALALARSASSHGMNSETSERFVAGFQTELQKESAPPAGRICGAFHSSVLTATKWMRPASQLSQSWSPFAAEPALAAPLFRPANLRARHTPLSPGFALEGSSFHIRDVQSTRVDRYLARP